MGLVVVCVRSAREFEGKWEGRSWLGGEKGSQPGGEGFGVSEGLQGAMEAELALMEVAFQSDDKLAAKNLSEHGDGKKESRARWHPTRSARGHHTMGMGMMFEFLIPGVEHAKEADFGAEMFGIASDFEEGFGTGLQQQTVKNFLILQSKWR